MTPSGSAVLDADGRYRYRLERRWGPGPAATVVMLNPSTADARTDDPTVRRCVGLARAWGCGALVVVNLYGLRARDPRDLWRARDPVGPDTDVHLAAAARAAAGSGAPLVAAWGRSARQDRVARVLPLLVGTVGVLGLTRDGHPRHPLYVPRGSVPTPWSPVSRTPAGPTPAAPGSRC